MEWLAAPSGRRGRPATFSEGAIQACLTLKALFGLPLRQATGLLASFLKLAKLDWPVPDFSTQLEWAIAIAARAHFSQQDQAGQPYILHALRVKLACSPGPAQIVGVLHDVVENTGWNLEGLQDKGFGEDILGPLRRVTKVTEDEDYTALIQRVAADPVAREVKMADLRDNMNLSRIKNPTERGYERIRKDEDALEVLTRA